MSVEEVRAVYQQTLVKDDVWYPLAWSWWTQWCTHTGFAATDNPFGEKEGPKGGPDPGPIDNDELRAEGKTGERGELHPVLEEGRHFLWVNEKVYKLLEAKYKGGPAFPRKVIARGLMQSTSIEMYPWFCSLAVASPSGPKDAHNLVMSKLSTLEDMVHQLPEEERPEKGAEMRFWSWEKKPAAPEGDAAKEGEVGEGEKPEEANPAETSGEIDWLLRFDKTSMGVKLEDLGMLPAHPQFLLDIKTADGTWSRNAGPKKDWRDFAVGDVIDAIDTANHWYESTIRDVKPDKILVHYEGWDPKWDAWILRDSPNLAPKNTHTTGPYQTSSSRSSGYLYGGGGSEKGVPVERGAVGLRNLGNTCFMNSTLQCLSNTPGLTDFFVDNKHKAQVNRENPLGWQGRVALEYGNLLQEIWGGSYSTVSPSKFKQVMGEIQPRFSGYQQHDSSELLSFLLDGLHEDLNRVKKKPPTDSVDSNGRPDRVVARESWHRHLLRNQSVIVDMMQGQLKSEVKCPECPKRSLTFDPFMFLSVPLPEAESVIQDIKFIPAPGCRDPPRVVKVKLPKRASALQLKQQLGKDLGINPAELLVAEIWRHKVHARLPDSQTFNSNGTEDLYVYHLPELGGEEKDKYFYINLQTHHMINDNKFRIFNTFPLVVPLEKELLNEYPQHLLRAALRKVMGPYLVDGWKDGEDDCETYLLDMMDGRASKCYDEIELSKEDDKKLNLTGKILYKMQPDDFSIGLFFKTGKKERYIEYELRASSTLTETTQIKLGDCLASFAKTETLPESEAWYCSDCKKHQTADKQMTLWSLPDILILHLKRFSYDRIGREKITTYVDFPMQGLDMGPWLVNPEEKENAIYDLFAVSNHFGNLGGGHYTAYAQNLVNQKWYNLDDSSVTEVEPESVKTSAAYVLFYRRRKPLKPIHKPEDFES
eukprot:gb/GEZN01001307.1/.p1 GENE.gb/GEZN01001307.1/~~gb/GEZN01001307.1/.p1  ORF type:complete len:930 (+),score=171.77 gb/GEZN01001307.1/:25-2814(+)